jgi:hypothetical protein
VNISVIEASIAEMAGQMVLAAQNESHLSLQPPLQGNARRRLGSPPTGPLNADMRAGRCEWCASVAGVAHPYERLTLSDGVAASPR